MLKELGFLLKSLSPISVFLKWLQNAVVLVEPGDQIKAKNVEIVEDYLSFRV